VASGIGRQLVTDYNVAAHLPRVPEIGFWEITDACNLRCIHCEADAGRAAPDELSTEEALQLAADLAAAGCRRMNLTGGEPLVRRDWPVIAQRLSELGIAVSIITNGVLVDPETVQRMLEAGVSGLSVSLDGSREVHDTIRVAARPGSASRYDAALGAIELAVSSPLQTAVITQVHRHNLHDLGRMYEQLVSLGVDVWQVQVCMPLGRLLRLRRRYLIDPVELHDLQDQLAAFIADGRMRIAVADNIGYYGPREPRLRGSLTGTQTFWMGCLAGCRVVALCANGDVKGCPSHPREFVVGNVRSTPFSEIWADGQRFSYNTAWNEQLLEGGCRRCPYRRICRAGCTTMAYAVTGTIYDNPYCVQRTRPQDARDESPRPAADAVEP
jgi:radical SAM protein with 4Fe4S-binding SPASM domain